MLYVFYMYNILGRIIILFYCFQGKSFLQQGTFLFSQFVVKWLCITNILVANKTKICCIVKETIHDFSFAASSNFFFNFFVQKLPIIAFGSVSLKHQYKLPYFVWNMLRSSCIFFNSIKKIWSFFLHQGGERETERFLYLVVLGVFGRLIYLSISQKLSNTC